MKKIFVMVGLSVLAVAKSLQAAFPVDTSESILTRFEIHDGDSACLELKRQMSGRSSLCLAAYHLSKMGTEDRARILGYLKLQGKRESVRIRQSASIQRGGVYLLDLAGDDIEMIVIPDDAYRSGIIFGKSFR